MAQGNRVKLAKATAQIWSFANPSRKRQVEDIFQSLICTIFLLLSSCLRSSRVAGSRALDFLISASKSDIFILVLFLIIIIAINVHMKSLGNNAMMQNLIKLSQGENQMDSKTAKTAALRNLEELIDVNRQMEEQFIALEEEVTKLEREGEEMDQEIEAKHKQLQDLKNQMVEEEQKEEEEEEGDMDQWISKVQNYTGCPPEVIEGLIALEYEGSPDEQEICLSCYQQMSVGAQCKYLPCYHLFHAECINNHLKVNTLCPACGEAVSM